VLPLQVPSSDGALLSSAGLVLTARQRSTVLSGGGFMGGSSVTVAVYSAGTVLVTAIVGADGTFSVAVTVPRDFAGQHTFVAIGYSSSGVLRTLTAQFRIVRGVLPTTSSPPAGQAAVLGCVLALLGVILFAAGSAGAASRVFGTVVRVAAVARRAASKGAGLRMGGGLGGALAVAVRRFQDSVAGS
jgi:hypothetical protein